MIFQLRGVVGVPDGSKTQQKPDFRAFQKPQSWFKKNCAEKYQLVIKLQHDLKKMVGFEKIYHYFDGFGAPLRIPALKWEVDLSGGLVFSRKLGI